MFNERVETFIPTPQPLGREEGARDSVQSPVANDLIYHVCVMKLQQKFLGGVVQRASGLVNTKGLPGESMP